MPISGWFWLLLVAGLLASFEDIKPSAAIFFTAAAVMGYWHTRR